MKIYVIGDSISVHYGPYLERELSGFADYARKGGPDARGTDWENPADANGGDSNLVLSFLAENLSVISADVMLLNCGLHDVRLDRQSRTYQVLPEAYRENLTTILERVHAAGIKPIWINSTPLIDAVHNARDVPYDRHLDDVIAYNKIAADVMASKNVPIIDLFGFMLSLGPDIYIDHVHLTNAVRAQQAAFIADWLKNYA
tara:strand:- start:2500 stop:3102 length:603 start_codon:yes stop_codon:yes gene_type:complete